MNRATPIRAAEPPPPRDRTASDVSASSEGASNDASLKHASPDLASYHRLDRRHDTSEADSTREASPTREDRPSREDRPGKPSAARPASDEAATTPLTPRPDPPSPDGDDPAFTLHSLLRLHAADLIVTLRQWGERLDTREATLDLRAAHLNLLERRTRSTPRRHEEAPDDVWGPGVQTGATPQAGPAPQPQPKAERGPSDASLEATISRGWRDELDSQRHAIDRLRADADRFASWLESRFL